MFQQEQKDAIIAERNRLFVSVMKRLLPECAASAVDIFAQEADIGGEASGAGGEERAEQELNSGLAREPDGGEDNVGGTSHKNRQRTTSEEDSDEDSEDIPPPKEGLTEQGQLLYFLQQATNRLFDRLSPQQKLELKKRAEDASLRGPSIDEKRKQVS